MSVSTTHLSLGARYNIPWNAFSMSMHCRIRCESTFFAPPGAFPREADRGLCNFLHVPLTKNPNFSDFGRLDGGRTLDPRCLYSVSRLFRGYIERFSNFYSRRGRNFASAREILSGHSVKRQIRRKSRYKESENRYFRKTSPSVTLTGKGSKNERISMVSRSFIFWPI